MSDYTPPIQDVRNHYAYGCGPEHTWNESRAEFDRWLAEHDAKVRAEALKEARDAINTTRNVPSLITLADKFGGYHQGQRSGLEMAEDIIDRIEREAGLK